MSHKTDIGFVDAHSERQCGDHDHAVFAQKPGLVTGPIGGAHAGVIGQRIEALLDQPGGGVVDPLAGGAVDNAGLAGEFGQKGEQLAPRLVLDDDAVADIGAVETGDELARILQRQALADFMSGLGIGGGGQRNTRNVGKAIVQDRQAEIFRTEIMTPLRDAMRFVDRKERDATGRKQLKAAIGEEPLGRHIEQINLACPHRSLDPAGLIETECGVEVFGAHAVFAQGVDLILHQSDQRRNHDAHAGAHQ